MAQFRFRVKLVSMDSVILFLCIIKMNPFKYAKVVITLLILTWVKGSEAIFPPQKGSMSKFLKPIILVTLIVSFWYLHSSI